MSGTVTNTLGQLSTKELQTSIIRAGYKTDVTPDGAPADLTVTSAKAIRFTAGASDRIQFLSPTVAQSNLTVDGDLTLTNKVSIGTSTYQGADHGSIVSARNDLLLRGQTETDEVVVNESALVLSQTTGDSFIVEGPNSSSMIGSVTTSNSFISSEDGLSAQRATLASSSNADFDIQASKQLRLSADRSVQGQVRLASATNFEFHPNIDTPGASATKYLTIDSFDKINTGSTDKSVVIRSAGTAGPLLLAGNNVTSHMLKVIGNDASGYAGLETTAGDLRLASSSGTVSIDEYSFKDTGVISKGGSDVSSSKIKLAPHEITNNALQITVDTPDGGAALSGVGGSAANLNMKIETEAGDLVLNSASNKVKANSYVFDATNNTIANSGSLKFAPSNSSITLDINKFTVDQNNHSQITTSSGDLFLSSASSNVHINDVLFAGSTIVAKGSNMLQLAGNSGTNFLQVTTHDATSAGNVMLTTSTGDLHLTSAANSVVVESLTFADSSISAASFVELKGSDNANFVKVGYASMPVVTTSAGALNLTSSTGVVNIAGGLTVQNSTLSSANTIEFLPNSGASALTFKTEGGHPTIGTRKITGSTNPNLRLTSDSNLISFHGLLNIVKNGTDVSIASTGSAGLSITSAMTTIESVKITSPTATSSLVESTTGELQLQSATGNVKLMSDLLLGTGNIRSTSDLDIIPASGKVKAVDLEFTANKISAASALLLRGTTVDTSNALAVSVVDPGAPTTSDVSLSTTGGALTIDSATNVVNIGTSATTVNVSGLSFLDKVLHGGGSDVIIGKNSSGNALRVTTANNLAELSTNAGDLSLDAATGIVNVAGVTFTKDGSNNGRIYSTSGTNLLLAGTSTSSPLSIGENGTDLVLTTTNNFVIESAASKSVQLISATGVQLFGAANSEIRSANQIQFHPGVTSITDTSKPYIVVSKTVDDYAQISTSARDLRITSATQKVKFGGLTVDTSNPNFSAQLTGTVAGKNVNITSASNIVEIEGVQVTNLGVIRSASSALTLESFTSSNDAASAATRDIKFANNVDVQTGIVKNTTGSLQLQPDNNTVEIDNLVVEKDGTNNAMMVYAKNSTDTVRLSGKNQTTSAIEITVSGTDAVIQSASSDADTSPDLKIASASDTIRIGDASSEVRLAEKIKVVGTTTLPDGTTGSVVESMSGDLNLGSSTGYVNVLETTKGLKTNRIESISGPLTLKAQPGQPVIIDGNLDVTGTINKVSVDELDIEDKTITLAHSNTGQNIQFIMRIDSGSVQSKIDDGVSVFQNGLGSSNIFSGRTYTFDFSDPTVSTADAKLIDTTDDSEVTITGGFSVDSGSQIATLVVTTAMVGKTFNLQFNDNAAEFVPITPISSILTTDGASNDGAGIEIAGILTDTSKAAYADAGITEVEKSFKFRNNGGLYDYSKADEREQPYWELQGGNFMLTRTIPGTLHNRPQGNGSYVASNTDTKVSYTFRINNNEQLEVVKTRGSQNGAYQASLNTVVAVFD